MPVHRLQYLVPSCRRPDRQHGARLLPRRHSFCVLLYLGRYHQEKDIIPGDVVVYNLKGQAIPIVHRVMTVQ